MKIRIFLIFAAGLFAEEVKNDPGSLTQLYQLAETHRSDSEWSVAIPYYEQRIQLGGDKEEIWCSKFGLADCYERVDDWPNALYWYLEAFQDIPSRSAPLLSISSHYRIAGENDLAYIFSKHGTRLFPNHDYQFDHELSIVSYYTRFKEDGYKAASDLLIRKDVPWFVKEQAYRNILFYTQNLKNAKFQPITIDLPLIEEWADEFYHPMNPAIQKTDEGYKVICRAVNYTQVGAKEFHTIDPQGFIRTKNFLVYYDKNFKLLSQHEILEDLPRDRSYCFVLGLEDCRIFEYEDHSWFTCTTRDTHPAGTPQISLCRLPNENGPEIHVDRITPLLGPDLERCEKNWLPFVQNGQFHVIYSYDPFTIYRPDPDSGECEVEISYEPTHDFSLFKGSAGPTPFDDGYLVLIHETVHFPDNSRVYLHRFLYLDRHFYVKQVSKPFTFLHQGIEFCSSMTISHSGTEMILALGIEDAKAYLCSIDLKTIRSLLTPLPSHL